MAAKKNAFLKTVALITILGVPTLLSFGLAYDVLSPREWAIGLVIWFAALLFWTAKRKLAAKKRLEPNTKPAMALNDDVHRRTRYPAAAKTDQYVSGRWPDQGILTVLNAHSYAKVCSADEC
jgi:hypothetical protein